MQWRRLKSRSICAPELALIMSALRAEDCPTRAPPCTCNPVPIESSELPALDRVPGLRELLQQLVRHVLDCDSAESFTPRRGAQAAKLSARIVKLLPLRVLPSIDPGGTLRELMDDVRALLWVLGETIRTADARRADRFAELHLCATHAAKTYLHDRPALT